MNGAVLIESGPLVSLLAAGLGELLREGIVFPLDPDFRFYQRDDSTTIPVPTPGR
jgi:hypothetical protein